MPRAYVYTVVRASAAQEQEPIKSSHIRVLTMAIGLENDKSDEVLGQAFSGKYQGNAKVGYG